MTIKKVAVLCGGDGREREVSLRSGEAVCKALNEAGEFEAVKIDLQALSEIDKVKGYDGAFIAMHGDWGEGGVLQAKLEELRIPYTGSGPKASALAMNKYEAQELFAKNNIRTPENLVWPVKLNEIVAELGQDIVVKPCSGGSTVGLTIIKGVNEEALTKAAKVASESYDSDVLIEKYIEGRELTCAVFEREGRAEALPIIEIKPHAGFYDYTNKYTAGATEYIVPAELDSEIANVISQMAVKAHEVLGCSGYSRSDFRLTPNGDAYILEVNTAPGMTATSLVPKAAKSIGISMPEFVTMIMKMASCDKNC